MPIVILGMHRSGTSLLARILMGLGVDMGSHFQTPDESNPDGFFEDLDFQEINREILKAAGGSWVTALTRKQIMSRRVRNRLQNRARSLIAEKDADPLPWGWKDPRNCLTVWFWHPLLEGPRYIVLKRNFSDVAKSLARIHGKMPRDWAPLIKHYRGQVSAFLEAHEVPMIEIDYEQLVDRDRADAAVRAIAAFSGVSMETVPNCLDFIHFRERI